MTDAKDKAMTGQAANIDREIYREPDKGNGSFYSDSIDVTKDGGIAIHVGGLCIVKSLQAWHALALTTPPAPQAEGEIGAVRKALDELWVDRCKEYLNTPLLTDMAKVAIAALHSTQAPARAYADGIEDAAKAVLGFDGEYNGRVDKKTRQLIAADIRAIANKDNG